MCLSGKTRRTTTIVTAVVQFGVESDIAIVGATSLWMKILVDLELIESKRILRVGVLFADGSSRADE